MRYLNVGDGLIFDNTLSIYVNDPVLRIRNILINTFTTRIISKTIG